MTNVDVDGRCFYEKEWQIVQNKQIYILLFKEQNYPTVPRFELHWKLIENNKDKLKRRERLIENWREEASRLWQNISLETILQL